MGKLLEVNHWCRPKPNIYRRTRGNAANGSLIRGTIDRAVNEFLKWLNVCVVDKGEHFYHSY